MKKKTIIIISILVVGIIIGLLIILFANPKAQLRRKLKVELPENAKIVRHSEFMDGLCIRHAYEICFTNMNFDEMMDNYLSECGDKNKSMNLDSILSDALGEFGVPYRKKWLNPDNETIVWYNLRIDNLRTVITQDDVGGYHVYIEWLWTPYSMFLQ